MRSTRTLPPALWLAALAALPLSGCFDEELEPGWGAAVDALVEEVEGGIWAEGGNPLADEDDGFSCELAQQCIDQCLDGGFDGCSCTETVNDDGERTGYCCCVNDTSCDFCGGVEGVEGEEEEEDGGPEGGRSPWRDWLRLACDPRMTRGENGGCDVSTPMDPDFVDSLEFEWKSDGGAYWSGGRGRFGSRWSGKATQTRRVMVTVRGPGGWQGFESRAKPANVRERGWEIPPQAAAISYTRKLPDTAWGGYVAPLTGDPFVGEGSGPWGGSHYVSMQPGLSSKPVVMLHDDLIRNGKTHKLVHGECGVGGGSFVNVYGLNKACGWKTRLAEFQGQVQEHEFRHHASLVKCLNTINISGDGRLEAIERIVGPDRSAVKREAERLWTNGLREKILDAKKSKQPDERFRKVLWTYTRPRGPWVKGTLKLQGHSGTDGCPK